LRNLVKKNAKAEERFGISNDDTGEGLNVTYRCIGGESLQEFGQRLLLGLSRASSIDTGSSRRGHDEEHHEQQDPGYQSVVPAMHALDGRLNIRGERGDHSPPERQNDCWNEHDAWNWSHASLNEANHPQTENGCCSESQPHQLRQRELDVDGSVEDQRNEKEQQCVDEQFDDRCPFRTFMSRRSDANAVTLGGLAW
jgi:hypothetical protein